LLMRAMFRPVFGAPFPLREDLAPAAIASRDGSRLEGAVHDLGPGARGAVVLCHPFLKYGFHYFAKTGIVDLVTQLGFSSVLFNFKGFGRSELKGHPF